LRKNGFEYSNKAQSAKEIARILKEGGKFCALIHHIDSDVTVASKSAIQQVEICQNSKLTQIVDQLLRRLRKLQKLNKDPRLDVRASELRNKFNQVAGQLLDYSKKRPQQDHINYYLNELSGVFSLKAKGLSAESKLDIVKAVKRDSKLYKLRMEAMLSASHDENKIIELKHIFESLNFSSVNVQEFKSDDMVAAWAFFATK